MGAFAAALAVAGRSDGSAEAVQDALAAWAAELDPEVAAEFAAATGDRAPCRCGHQLDAHQHYRAGTDCALCPPHFCAAFHRA